MSGFKLDWYFKPIPTTAPPTTTTTQDGTFIFVGHTFRAYHNLIKLRTTHFDTRTRVAELE